MSRSEIRKSNGSEGRRHGHRRPRHGIWSTAIIPFILIIAAIAIPNLCGARMAPTNRQPFISVREINTAEVMYRTAYPDVVSPAFCLIWEETSHLPHPPSRRNCWRDRVTSGEVHGYRLELRNCVNSEAEATNTKGGLSRRSPPNGSESILLRRDGSGQGRCRRVSRRLPGLGPATRINTSVRKAAPDSLP
jgi:hypothetical protein